MSQLNNKIRPLVIASSGGGGLIMAAQTIINNYKAIYGDRVEFNTHAAKLESDHSATLLGAIVRIGIWVMSLPWLGNIFRDFNNWLGLNNLPERRYFNEEIQKLNDKRKDDQGNRTQSEYIDMLLDIYPAGYQICAIFNALQANDNMKDMAKTVNKQFLVDLYNYVDVKKTIFNILKMAAAENKPYTELMCTQPMSLAAMTDAVIEYNTQIVDKRNSMINSLTEKVANYEARIQNFKEVINDKNVWRIYKIWASISLFFEKRILNKEKRKLESLGEHLETVKIKQYMPDLATPGASHYFDALNKFSKKQREQMELFVVAPLDNSLSTLNHKEQFSSIIKLAPDINPMLRNAFKQTDLLQEYLNTEFEHTIEVAGEPDEVKIPGNIKVASIMLGTLAGNATVDYIKPLLASGYGKIIIFRGNNLNIDKRIESEFSPQDKERIVLLGTQGDAQIAPIMTRSQCVIIRCGGLSITEQMAMPLLYDKRILIHHSDRIEGKELSTGLPWEDENANCLIEFIKKNRGNTNAIAKKTYPAYDQIMSDLNPENDEEDEYGYSYIVGQLSGKNNKHGISATGFNNSLLNPAQKVSSVRRYIRETKAVTVAAERQSFVRSNIINGQQDESCNIRVRSVSGSN